MELQNSVGSGTLESLDPDKRTIECHPYWTYLYTSQTREVERKTSGGKGSVIETLLYLSGSDIWGLFWSE